MRFMPSLNFIAFMLLAFISAFIGLGFFILGLIGFFAAIDHAIHLQ